MKDNQEACHDLIDHIGKLRGPLYSTLESYEIIDIDVVLQADIKRLQECAQ